MAKKKKSKLPKGADQVLASNRKALHEYEISEKFEAGIALVGSEVKSVRDSQVSLLDGYVTIEKGEAWLSGVKINEYPWANRMNHVPTRTRKLLLHRREIKKLDAKVNQRGFTIVPLSMYLKNGRVKVEIGVGRGRREFEKRHAKKDAQARRDIDQEIARHAKGTAD